MEFPSCFKAATIFQLKSQVSLNSTQFLAEDCCKQTWGSCLPLPWACRLPNSQVPSSEQWLHGKAPGTTEGPSLRSVSK